MNDKKYVIFPGNVISPYDGDEHYISANKLIELYKVDRDECIIIHDEFEYAIYRKQIVGLTFLYPRTDGNYTI